MEYSNRFMQEAGCRHKSVHIGITVEIEDLKCFQISIRISFSLTGTKGRSTSRLPHRKTLLNGLKGRIQEQLSKTVYQFFLKI